jgi:hypothetical protein
MHRVLSGLVLVTLAAQQAPNLSGTWVFNAVKSQNVGMMSAAHLVSIVTQTPTMLIVRDTSTLNGATETRETHYNLTGTPVDNDTPMGEHARTTTKWSANILVTTWETEGAVTGTKVIRTETRHLSADGATMYLESVRGSAPPLVMAFDRK